MCNWLSKLFGCKCQCEKETEMASAPKPEAPVSGNVVPTAGQPENVEKNQ